MAFAVLTVWIASREPAVPGLDEQIHAWVVSRRGHDSVIVARDLSWAGVTWIVLPALVAVGAATAGAGRRLRSGLLLSLTASTGVYAEIRINALIGRARPPIADWAGAAGGSSFPSGHTTAATLFAISCAWALTTRVRAGWPRRAIWAGAGAYAAAVGWSRVWLGVHWPTDVIGGWLYSIAWMTGSIAMIITLQPWAASRRAARRQL